MSEIQDGLRRAVRRQGHRHPARQGLDRALWAVPVAAFVVAAGGLTLLGKRWVKKGAQASKEDAVAAAATQTGKDDALDKELDEELRRLGD